MKEVEEFSKEWIKTEKEAVIYKVRNVKEEIHLSRRKLKVKRLPYSCVCHFPEA